ncbi:hypothetical protein [Luteolibacter soli]|uniref:hypothetical protein n=1 Tax=Luteolibacter soli TaxID=3135280 RepID=UPI00311A135B
MILPLLAAAQEPQAMARTSIKQQGEIWMGQKVTMVVELLAPGFFAGNASFDLPRVSGVLIVPPVGSPLVSSEESGGVSYTVQRHELMLFAQAEGEVTVPACEIRIEFKRSPLDKETVKQAVKTQQLSFKAMRPPGTSAGQTIITSTDLKMEETWKPEPGANAKLGAAFVRTLKWTASDVTGMAFPPFRPAPVQGLGIYRAEPVVEDSEERGSLHGERRDTVTYVCKAGGRFEIPPLTMTWWDPEKKELKKIVFKAHAFEVPVPPPPPVTLRVWLKRVWREHGTQLVAGAVGVLFLLLALRVFGARVTGFLKRLLPRHLPSLNP